LIFYLSFFFLANAQNATDASNLSDTQEHTVMIITKVTCALSILGAGSIILCYLSFEQLKTKLLRDLVVGLSACDLGTGIVDMLPNHSDLLCKSQALLGMYFPMASFIYTDAIGLMIYLSVVELRTKSDLNSMLKYIHILAFGIPFLICLVIAIEDVEGSDTGFGTGVCWIPVEHETWRLLGGKILEWTSWLFVLSVYLTTLWRISKLNIPTDLRTTSLKMLFIPAIFVILRVPSAIRTIHDYIYDESAIFWLSVMQAFGDYGQGFANGIWFVLFQHEVRREVLSFVLGKDTFALTSSSESDIVGFLKSAPGNNQVTGTSAQEQDSTRGFEQSDNAETGDTYESPIYHSIQDQGKNSRSQKTMI